MAEAAPTAVDSASDIVDGIFVVGGQLRDVLTNGASDFLRDHLSSLLQVHNLSVLVGSGASVHLGSPLIRSMSNADLDDLVTKAGSDLTDEGRAVLEAVNPESSVDLVVPHKVV